MAERIAICITKKPVLVYGKLNFLRRVNSSRHNHMFLIFIKILLGISKKTVPEIFANICSF